MEIKQLKAAYQLAEMHHNADPANEAKKHAYEKARSDYEQAEQTGSGKSADTLKEVIKEVVNGAEGFSILSIEELEALLKQKKADQKKPAEAEKKAATDATEAATVAAKAEESGSSESEGSKKNEIPS